MDTLGLNSLSNIHVIGQFGPHLHALAWLIATATLMYVGPATISVLYVLLYDLPQADSQATPVKVLGRDETQQQKAA